MSGEDFWEIFKDTGDPLCWLMGRAAENESSAAPAEDIEDGPAPSR